MLVHTGQYKHYCDICRKGYRDLGEYKSHMRAHQGLKYHCNYCAKPFATQQSLTLTFISSYWQV